MDPTALRVDSRKGEFAPLDLEVLKLRRRQNRVFVGLCALLALILLCGAGLIWLAEEVADDDTTTDATNTVQLRSEASESDGQSLFAGSGYWTIKEPLPFARSDHHVIAVDDFIYIIGGQNSNGSVVEDVTIYDTVLGTYASGPPLPVPVYRSAAAYDDVNREIYILGGLSESDGSAQSSVFKLDLDRQRWRQGPDLPTPRSDLCGAFVDGHVYAAGGYSLNYEATLDTVEALNVASRVWTTVKSMPTPRGDCKAARLDNKLVIVGGYYDATSQWTADAFRDEIEIYSPVEDVWEERARMRNARGDKSVAVLTNNRLLAIGGETHNRGLHTKVATHHVEEYIFSEDVWIERAPLPEATFRAGSAYVDGMVFVFGGHRTCDVPTDGDEGEVCVESEALQVYFDFEHPNIFIL